MHRAGRGANRCRNREGRRRCCGGSPLREEAVMHTKGLWEFDPETGRIDAVVHRKPTDHINKDGTPYIGGLIALPYSCEEGSLEANAKLIAAAPELLDALKAFSDYVHAEDCSTDGRVEYSSGQIRSMAFRARAAIAKATGEER